MPLVARNVYLSWSKETTLGVFPAPYGSWGAVTISTWKPKKPTRRSRRRLVQSLPPLEFE